MASLISENFKFMSLFFKSKDVVIFNGLIALGTVASQTAYNVFAFSCPCSSERNYLYGLAAIGIPALALFLIGIMLNKNTWNLVSECRARLCRRLTGPASFALLGSVLGRAVVAPVTWSVLSLLRGEAYVCARSEFVDPASLEGFPEGYGPQNMARFPCQDVPKELLPFWAEIERQLKYESQLLGWLLTGLVAVIIFLLLCMKRCFSPLGEEQETYWRSFRSSEEQLFQRTATVHAKILAAENVKQFFGFVALDQEDKTDLEQYQNQAQTHVPISNWKKITGVYLYKENNGVPLYSKLNKWAVSISNKNTEADEREMEALC